MPKGQKSIIWTLEQDAKLFYAILAAQKFDINFEGVAKAFGGHVPASAIQTRLQILRKKARGNGSNPVTTAISTSISKPMVKRTATKNASSNISNSKKPSHKRKRGGMLTSDSDDEDETVFSEASENEDADAKRFRTAPSTPAPQTSIAGQITKPRISPRNLAKKDYKTIDDPFVGSGTCDADGNEVFEKTSDEEEEEEEDVDGGDGTNDVENEVKMEMVAV